MAKINKYETEKNKIIEYQGIIDDYYNKLIDDDMINNIFDAINIPYKDYKVKNNHNNNKDLFNEDEDKYLMCLMFKYGYRNWNPIKYHIVLDPLMKFNLNMKMKSEQELLERANYLIMCLKMHKKKENNKKEISNKKNNEKQPKTKKKIKISKNKKKKIKK